MSVCTAHVAIVTLAQPDHLRSKSGLSTIHSFIHHYLLDDRLSSGGFIAFMAGSCLLELATSLLCLLALFSFKKTVLVR